jgi:hypothetical protein
MYHTAAYTASTNNATDVDLAALSDDILFIQNGHFVAPGPLKVFAAAALGATLLRAKINTPKMRQITPNYIRPIATSTLPPANPNVATWQDSPLQLNQNEEIQIQTTDSTGTTDRVTVVLMLGNVLEQIPQGDIYNLRFTSVTAAVANAWTTIQLVYEIQLPVGIYAVVGGDVISTNGIAYRLIFDQQYWRPGFLMSTANGNRNPYQFMTRDLGLWGRFSTTSLPRCQVLCNAADASFEGYLQIIRLS